MTPETDCKRNSFLRFSHFVTHVAILLAALSFLSRILTHFPFFDESTRIRFLWLMSEGLRPNIDYFTPHPSLGYILSLPLMNTLPMSAYSYLGLRGTSFIAFTAIGYLFWRHGKNVCGMGAAGLLPFLLVITSPAIANYCAEYSIDHISTVFAITAFCLMFSEHSGKNLFMMTTACTISILIMPKFLYPLFLGAATTVASACIVTRNLRQTLVPAAAGVVLAFAGTATLFTLHGISLWSDIDHSFLLHGRLAASGHSNVAAGTEPVTLKYVVEHLINNPLLLLATTAGFAGIISLALKKTREYLYPCAGIVLGAIISALMMRSFLEQYVTPVLLCFALAVPFALRAFSAALPRQAFTALLALLTMVSLTMGLEHSLRQFSQTPYNARGNTSMHKRLLGDVAMVKPGISKLAEYDQLLSVIPESETVAAVWPFHPIFRRDVTFITVDDIPTHAQGLRADDPIRSRFNREFYRAALNENPPAYIAPMGMEVNYPPGWLEETMLFLEKYGAMYKEFSGGYLRSDLYQKATTGQ